MIMNSGIDEVSKLTANGGGGTKFDAVAIGTSNTAPAATQTALIAEVVTGGGERKSGSGVTATLVTTTSTEDTIRFVATWAFTAAFGLNEFGVFNAASAGVMLLRDIFASVLNILSADSLTLTIDIVGTDEVVSADSVVTFAGITEGNKLIATDLTPAVGRIAAIALGEGTGSLSQSDTALSDELVAADSVGLGRGQVTSGPTVSVVTTTVTNDTVRVVSTWSVTGTRTVRETGLFNTATPSSGTLFVRYKFPSVLNLINTDTFQMTMDFVSKGV